MNGPLAAPDEGLSISVESLSAMLEIAREHGVVFTIEPHTGSIAVTPDKVKNLLSKVPGLRLSLDYTHFIGTGWKVKDLIPLHDFAYHLHGKPANANAAKCLFYEGEDFFPPLIADLVARKWDGVMAVECMYPMDAKDRLSHPAFQTVLLAGHLEKCLMEAREGKTRI
jgi:sugar phosphate isomerase/epimerase